MQQFCFVLLVFGLEFPFRINQPSIGRVRTVSVQKVAKKKRKAKASFLLRKRRLKKS
jgi:ribosomal protein L19